MNFVCSAGTLWYIFFTSVNIVYYIQLSVLLRATFISNHPFIFQPHLSFLGSSQLVQLLSHFCHVSRISSISPATESSRGEELLQSASVFKCWTVQHHVADIVCFSHVEEGAQFRQSCMTSPPLWPTSVGLSVACSCSVLALLLLALKWTPHT